MTELSGDGLLARPVRLHGIDLGRPVDVLLDREALRDLLNVSWRLTVEKLSSLPRRVADVRRRDIP